MAKKKLKPNCWKVVKQNRASACAEAPLAVTYPVGVRVRAPVGGLLAFREKWYAKRFASHDHDLIILAAIGMRRIKLPSRNAEWSTLENAAWIWKGPKLNRLDYSWPAGTVAYKEITVLE